MKNPDMNHRMRYPLMSRTTAILVEGLAEEIEVVNSVATIGMDTNKVDPLRKEPGDVTVTFNIPQGFETDWYTFARVLEAMQNQYLRAVGEKT